MRTIPKERALRRPLADYDVRHRGNSEDAADGRLNEQLIRVDEQHVAREQDSAQCIGQGEVSLRVCEAAREYRRLERPGTRVGGNNSRRKLNCCRKGSICIERWRE